MSIALTVKYSIQEETENRQSYDLEVEVTNAVDVSDKIFVFQRKVLSSTDDQANRLMDQFVCLADPVDLEEFPEDSPLFSFPLHKTGCMSTPVPHGQPSCGPESGCLPQPENDRDSG